MSDNRKCGHFLRSSNKLMELTEGAITCPWCEIAGRDATIAELRFEVGGLKEAIEQAAIRNTQIAEEGAEFRSELGAADGTIRELRESLKMSNAVSDCLGRQVADKDADRIFFRDELKKAETALAAARVNEARWKRMAEYQYGKRQYPDQMELSEGALDAFFKLDFDGKDALAAEAK